MDINLLIEKFWNGTASASEKQQLLRILNEHGTDIEQDLLAEFEEPVIEEPLVEADHRANLLNGIHEKISAIPEQDHVASVNRKKKRIVGWAAVVLVLIGCTMAWQLLNNKVSYKPVKTVIVLKMDTIFNHNEIPESVALPDQSKVLLYPGSQIAFEHGFLNRDIQLVGKASFDVMHDTSRVFTVSTGEVLTTDIGTVFEIDARNEQEVLIRLIEGKIKVGQVAGSQMGLDDRLLNPGESIRVNVQSGQVHLETPIHLKRHKKRETSKRLAFDKTPLDVVFKEIEKKYQVNIAFYPDDLINLTFSGTIEAKDSLANILEIICYMNNLKCSQKEHIYTIRK